MDEDGNDNSGNNERNSNNGDASSSLLDREETINAGSNEHIPCPTNENEDTSSIASGFSSLLSFRHSSSSKRRSKKRPKHVVLPPYLVDAQLVTKKHGKDCQRLVLLRFYRVDDVGACGGEGEALDMMTMLGDGELLDVPSPRAMEKSMNNELNSASVHANYNSGVSGGSSTATNITPRTKKNQRSTIRKPP